MDNGVPMVGFGRRWEVDNGVPIVGFGRRWEVWVSFGYRQARIHKKLVPTEKDSGKRIKVAE